MLPASIVDSSFHGFTIMHEMELENEPSEAFRAFVEDLAKWWNGSHSFSANAENMYFNLEDKGCLCESWGEGNLVRHMDLVNLQPGSLIVLRGGLGPLQMMAVQGSMSISFEPIETGTKVRLVYRVGGYAPSGLASLARPVDYVLGEQMQRFEQFMKN